MCHQYFRLRDDDIVILVGGVHNTDNNTDTVRYITLHYIFTVYYYINTVSTLQYIRVCTLLHYSLNRNVTVMTDTLVHYYSTLFIFTNVNTEQ